MTDTISPTIAPRVRDRRLRFAAMMAATAVLSGVLAAMHLEIVRVAALAALVPVVAVSAFCIGLVWGRTETAGADPVGESLIGFRTDLDGARVDAAGGDAVEMLDGIVRSPDRAAFLLLRAMRRGEDGSRLITARPTGEAVLLGVRRDGDGLIWDVTDVHDLIDEPMRALEGTGAIVVLGKRPHERLAPGQTLSNGGIAMLADGKRGRSLRLSGATPDESVWAVFPLDDADLAVSTPAALLDLFPTALVLLDPRGVVLHANAPARTLAHGAITEGADLAAVLTQGQQPLARRLAGLVSAGQGFATDVFRLAGVRPETFLRAHFVHGLIEGEPSILAMLTDDTEVKTLEAQFVQSQKMQAVGQLAGGVAHDFNNLLTAIAGHCDLVLARQAPGGTDHADLLQIRQNTNRATALVRQLLSFSRKQTLQPRNLDLPHVLGDLTHLLNRLIGAKITLGIWHDEDLPTVMMDPRQFEQIVMNLVVNARDAMPGGGRIEIRADEREVTAPIEREGRIIAPGRYVGLVVTDTGTGIPPEIVERIFEPFFTTKGPGRGTGLGLSTVAGIVKQAGGNLFVTSTEGAGTRFEILLPAFDEPEEQAIAAPVHAPRVADPAAAGGHVLLVEDEASVRSFARRALELRGYRVTEAPTGSEALELLQEGLERPDIIVTDVMMPGLDGPEWIARQRAEGPVIPVLYISGYSEDVFGEAGLDSRAVGFLAKPFALNDLGAAVGELLAEPGVPIADQCAANPS